MHAAHPARPHNVLSAARGRGGDARGLRLMSDVTVGNERNSLVETPKPDRIVDLADYGRWQAAIQEMSAYYDSRHDFKSPLVPVAPDGRRV